MNFNTAVEKVRNYPVNIINNVDNRYIPSKERNTMKYLVNHYLGAVGNCSNISNKGYGTQFYVHQDGSQHQATRVDAVLWQVGTKNGYKHPYARNSNCIGIEMCCFCDGDKTKAGPDWWFSEETMISTAALDVYLMRKYNIPIDHLLRHYDVTGKTCPAPFVHNNGYHGTWTWEFFKKVVKAVLDGTEVSSEPSEQFKAIGTAICTGDRVRVRKTPNGDPIGSLNTGNRFEIDGKEVNGWTHVKVAGIGIGYVFNQYVKKDVERAAWVHEADGRWWYRHGDGSYTKNGWEKINGKWYHFDASGWMQTGWLKLGNTWYYLDGSGAMATGWRVIGDKWYFFDTDGHMLHDRWAYNTANKNYYWLKTDGTWDGITIPDPRQWPSTCY